MQKNILIKKILQKIDDEITDLEEGASSNHKASVEAPGAMQSHSDTSKFQNKVAEENIMQMIAKKKAERDAIEKCETPENIRNMCVGAFVVVDDGEVEKRYILLPGGAGIEIWDDESLDSYMTVTPDVPIGKALLGKGEGNKAVFKIGSKEKRLLIKKVW